MRACAASPCAWPATAKRPPAPGKGPQSPARPSSATEPAAHVAAARPILTAAAWDPELAPLLARLGPARARTAAGVVTRAIGVGLVEAAAGAARAIAELA